MAYTYNGKLYSDEAVAKKASEKGMQLVNYVQKYKLTPSQPQVEAESGAQTQTASQTSVMPKGNELTSSAFAGTGIPSLSRVAQYGASLIPFVNKFIENPYKDMTPAQMTADITSAAVPFTGVGGMLVGATVGGTLGSTGIDKAVFETIDKFNKGVSGIFPEKAQPYVKGGLEMAEVVAPAVAGYKMGLKPSETTKFENVIGKDVMEAGPQQLTQDIYNTISQKKQQAGAKIGEVKDYMKQHGEVNINDVPLNQQLQDTLIKFKQDNYGKLTDTSRSHLDKYIREAAETKNDWNAIQDFKERFGHSEFKEKTSTQLSPIYDDIRTLLNKNVKQEKLPDIQEANPIYSETKPLKDEFKVNIADDVKEKLDMSSSPNLAKLLQKYAPEQVKKKMLGEIYDNAYNAAGQFDKVKLGKYLNKVNRNDVAKQLLGADYDAILKMSNATPDRFAKFISELMNNPVAKVFEPLTKINRSVQELAHPGYEQGKIILPGTLAATERITKEKTK